MGVPEGAASLVLIVDDPDAPVGAFTHWLAWGIDPASGGLAEGERAPLEGRNDFGQTGYRGPCPPRGHGPHRYFFGLYALSAEPDVESGASRQELERAFEDEVLARAQLVGTYER
jgi:Raf kinase inhibitor-like YbhB/YbcL family protein